jgi:hypothetical protein
MADLLSLERIRTEGTQVRRALSETVIREYADALAQGAEFPPIEVYYDETAHWLADGFHRLQAAAQAGRDSIAATLHPGGQRAALLHALGANDTHGYRRTDGDRRHAIELMLADPEWQAWSNREIARQCRVSEFLVRTVRQELAPPQETEAPPAQTRKVTRGGKQFTMRTERIGAAARTRAQAPAASGSALSPVPAAPVAPSENGGAAPEYAAPSASAMPSQIDTPEVGVPPPHQEETSPPPVAAATTEDGVHPAPTTPPPQPSLMEVWQQASDDERTAFVAVYRDDLRRLLAAHDEQQPTKRASAARRTQRAQSQQKPKRQRAAARKR